MTHTLQDVAKFLLGEGPLDGVWYGEPNPAAIGNFWWRKHLRSALAQQGEPCDMGQMCLNCQPRGPNGECPDQAAPAAQPDWSLLEATQESLREHMAMVKELQAKLAQQGEPVAWVNLEKLAKAGMAYATSVKVTGLQVPVYAGAAPATQPVNAELLRSSKALLAALNAKGYAIPEAEGDALVAAIAAAPAAQRVDVDSRVLECAKRLVEHADFKLGGILSADSKAKDIPSRAVSQVKARHLAALRDAIAAAPAAQPDAIKVIEQMVRALGNMITVSAHLGPCPGTVDEAQAAIQAGQKWLEENK